MSPQPLVYVHGAGPQKPAPDLKHDLDLAIFGRDMATTRLARYAHVRWGGAGGGGAGIAPGGATRTARTTAIRTNASEAITPTAAAADLVATQLGTRTAGLGAAPPRDAATLKEAQKLVSGLYGRADRIATASAAPAPAPAAGGPLGLVPVIWDPIFRFVVGKFAADVLDYLFGPFTEAMRAPVRQALLQTPTPRIVVAHSLGTIITYDVLSEPALAGLDVQLLVTLGCPLAYGNVQQRLRDGKGRPHPVPPEVHAWSNYADRFDPVALDQTLHDDLVPDGFVKDHEVNNPARDNHELIGYASIAMVRAELQAAAG